MVFNGWDKRFVSSYKTRVSKSIWGIHLSDEVLNQMLIYSVNYEINNMINNNLDIEKDHNLG